MFKSWLIGSAALSVLALWALPTQAGVPVTDSAVISESTKIAANTAEQLKRLNDIKQVTDEILQSIGQQGQGMYDLSKNEDWQEFADGGDLLRSLREYGPNTCAIAGCEAGEAGGTEKFADLKSARAYIMKTLYAAQVGSRADRSDYLQARRNAQREANVSAYALALVSRQYLAEAGERAKKLDGMVNGADDLRADLRANSAVALAQHAELTSMLAMLTSMLERDATSFLVAEEDYISSEGGTTPPDVYNERDYTPDGIRIGVGSEASREAGPGGGSSLTEAIDSLGENTGGLLGDALATGDADIAHVFQSASDSYGGNDSAVALEAAGAAAGLDGNQALQDALSAAASSASDGEDISSALFAGAAANVGRSGNDELRWLYDSAQYGMSTGDFSAAVDAGGAEQPMIDVMFEVARTAAWNSDVPGISDVLYETEAAYRNGEIDPHRAALVAVRVATQASGDYETAALLEGAIYASQSSSARDAILTVLNSSGASGEHVNLVYDILYAADW